MMTKASRLSPPRRRLLAISAALVLAVLSSAGVLLLRGAAPVARFIEYRMPDPHDGPMAIAAATDGTVWFTIDQANAIGRVRGGRIELLPTPGRNYEPLGLAVAADGSAWYTDIKAGAVMRISPSGEVAQFALDSAIVRLGRVAIAPDGSVWFADATEACITQLKDGTFTRHEIGSADSGPYGVAVTSDGIVWATLQAGGKLIRIEPNGAMATIDLSRPGVVPTDVAVGTDGSVWFLQFRANRIGRLKNGEFSDFKVPDENAGLSGLVVAADGAVWFGMVRSSSLGRLRDGRVATFRLPRDDARPYSLAVDPDGNVWYADISGYVGMLPARYAHGS
jgi:virginiamycin B lyase